MTLSLLQLAEALDLEYLGDPLIDLGSAASFDSAVAGDLCFIQQLKYLSQAESSQCSAVIAPADIAADITSKGVLISDNPQYHFALAINLLKSDSNRNQSPGIHPSAQVSDSARLGSDVSIAALVVIEDEVVIGDGVHIGAASVIEKGARIDAEVICSLDLARCEGESVVDRWHGLERPRQV